MEIYPVGIAAGMIKEAAHIEDGLPELVHMIMFGSFTLDEREGNKEPVFWFDPYTNTSINAVGLRNKGLKHFLDVELPKIFARLEGTDCKIGVSLAPLKKGDAKTMLAMIRAHPNRHLISRIEINAACPNHRDGDVLHPVLAHDPIAVTELLEETIGTKWCRTALKIAPDTSDATLESIVTSCVFAGFDYIVSGNTRLSNSVIGGEQRLSVEKGGIAGLPLLESGVTQVAKLRRIIDGVGSPRRPLIIGVGGIMNGNAIHRYRGNGAVEVQLGTLYYQFQTDGVRDLLTSYY